MFIKNAWYIAAWAHEVKDQPFARTICNEAVVLYREPEVGKVGALQDRCCHRGTPLRFGQVVEDGIECGYHGLVFDVSGACIRIPGQDRIPPKAKVRSYPLVEKNQFLWIWMGDAALADPALIVDFPYHDDQAKWPHKHEMLPDQRQLYADGRQPDGPDPSRLSPRQDDRRQPVAARRGRDEGDADADRGQIHPLDEIARRRRVTSRRPGSAGVSTGCRSSSLSRRRTVLQWTGATDAGSGVEPARWRLLKFRLFHGLTPETDDNLLLFLVGSQRLSPERAGGDRAVFGQIASAFLEESRHGRGATGAARRTRRERPCRYRVGCGAHDDAPARRPDDRG